MRSAELHVRRSLLASSTDLLSFDLADDALRRCVGSVDALGLSMHWIPQVAQTCLALIGQLFQRLAPYLSGAILRKETVIVVRMKPLPFMAT
jgi:hypothetical protein